MSSMISAGQQIETAAAHLARGDRHAAARLYLAILADRPDAAAALRAIYQPPFAARFGEDIEAMQAAYNRGDHATALALADIVIFLQPQAEALHNFGAATAAALGRHDEAVLRYDRALALRPDYADAHANRGASLRSLGRLEEAVASYDRAIAAAPGTALAYYGRANALRELKHTDRALADYQAAIERDPNHRDAWSNLGNLLATLDRTEEALFCHERAIALAPSQAAAHFNRASVLQQLKRFDEAAEGYEQTLRLDPNFADAAARLFFMRANMCAWPAMTGPIAIADLGITTAPVAPFDLLAAEDAPRHHLLRARRWATELHGAARGAALPRPVPADRIRLGYYSADFHDHATMHLIARLFERHDRGRFEVHAFSYGPDRQDAMRQRLLSAVEHFHDITAIGDPQAAALARNLQIDIAIDLKGHTQDSRTGIFAHRAAPIQVNYLGYPGSLGLDWIDYIVADRTIIPPDRRSRYSEKVVALPDCYQANDDQRPIAAICPSRAELGLPEAAFVFCCFNNSYKISAAEFDVWMRCLARIDGSVLWLLRDNRWAEASLREEAQARGIAPDRLIFADRMANDRHLARHAQADLFLDTFAYNAHTTASDALWAGLPIVTKIGDGFAARVAASLLVTLGLPDLVTDSAEAYEARIIALASSPDELDAVRARLAAARTTSRLFDTASFTRSLETAFIAMHDRHLSGLAPDHIDVAD